MTDAPIEVTLDDDPVPENGAPHAAAPAPEATTTTKAKPRAKARPAVEEGRDDSARQKGPPNFATWRAACPTDTADEAWQWILKHIGEIGWLPQHISIKVLRLTNFVASKPTYLNPAIRGDQVMGDPANGYSAGQALEEWVLDYYHHDPGTPNTYRLRFTGPENEHIAECEPFTWDSWATMDARRRAIRGAMNRPVGAAPPAPPAGSPPQAWSAPAIAGAPVAPDARRLGYLERIAEEHERAKAEGRPPRDVVDPSAASSRPADWERQLDLEKRVAVAEAEKRWIDEKAALVTAHGAKVAELENAIKSLETKSKDDSIAARIQQLQDRIEHPPPPPPHEVEQRYLSQLVARGIVTTGPDGQAQPVKSVLEGFTLEGAIAHIIQDPATYAKLQAAYQSYRDRIRSVHGLEEPRTEIVPADPEEPETPKGVLGMAKDWISKNGDVLLAMGLEGVDQAAGAVLVPSAAASIKGVVAIGKEQLKRKSEAASPRAAPPPPGGWKPPSV